MRLIRPSKAELRSLFGSDIRTVWVCSPWVSSQGVEYLRACLESVNMSELASLEIWLRVNFQDFQAGLTDYKGLSSLVAEVRNRAPRATISIWQSDRLHAKCFATERGSIIGSCNLTQAGFEGNVELAVRLESGEALGQISVRDVMRADLQQLTEQAWNDFVKSLEGTEPVKPTYDAAAGRENWESFVQQVLSEGPPQLRTQIR